MPQLTERQRIALDLEMMSNSRHLLSRRLRYMCRNNNNAYSVQDITLALFAINVAQSLEKHLFEKLTYCDIKNQADARYISRCRLAELREMTDKQHVEHSSCSILLCEGDVRDTLMEIEELEFKELLWRVERSEGAEAEDEKARLRALPQDKASDGFSFVRWAERARREDILSGENQDFAVLLTCFAEHAEQHMQSSLELHDCIQY